MGRSQMKKRPLKRLGNRTFARKKSSKGFSLIEVVIAMALTTLMSAGLYSMGLQVRRSADRNRLATEARSLAKERLEEIVATGIVNLAKPSNSLLDESRVTSQMHYELVQTPWVIWHAADGSIAAPADADYAEVHITVSYRSPNGQHMLGDTYSILVN